MPAFPCGHLLDTGDDGGAGVFQYDVGGTELAAQFDLTVSNHLDCAAGLHSRTAHGVVTCTHHVGQRKQGGHEAPVDMVRQLDLRAAARGTRAAPT